MRPTLFRPEALAGVRMTLLGEVLQERRLPFRLVTAGSVAAVLALLALCIFGEYTRKVHVTGFLAPDVGVIRVPAGQAGTLVAKHVREGQHVSRGDVLYVVSTERASPTTPRVQAAATAAIRERMAALAAEHAAQRSVLQWQANGVRGRLASMDGEHGQAQAMRALQQERIAAAQAALAGHERLQAEGFVAAAQVDQKKAELLDQRARLGDLLRSQAAVDRDAAALRLELQSTQMKERQEDLRFERERVQLAQDIVESESRGAATVNAPADGVATAVLGELGQATQAQTVLLTILPQDALLQAKLLVPSRAIGFLAVGDTVSLRYPSFPYQRFGAFRGRIVEIPRSTAGNAIGNPNGNTGTSADAEQPVAPADAVFRVSVALDAQRVGARRAAVPLQNGMAVEADVWVERMTLLQWIFEPLAAAAGKV